MIHDMASETDRRIIDRGWTLPETVLVGGETHMQIQGGSNMTGTDLYVNKPHCAAAVRP